TWPSRAWVQAEPLGVALIIGPWNYPAQLLLVPLVSAIAAGNCAVLKPSELAPHTADVISALICESFADDFVSVVKGDAAVSAALLRERFDKIFFTGSTRVGRIVAAAAARNLTPVTLELGGKCPAVVCSDADVEVAARRIAWGKFMNAGQTCVAPDHVFVARGSHDRFVAALKRNVPASEGRIVNRAQFDRLTNYLREGTIAFGGGSDRATLSIEPTILTELGSDAAILEEEIFGPVLPVIEFDRVADVIRSLRQQPAPLALYLFTRDRDIEAQVLAQTRSGGVCINDVVSQMLGPDLPFGGVGESGMGRYHGRAGFDAFSNPRTIMRRRNWPDLPFRYSAQTLSFRTFKRTLGFLLR
ncbi:MAG TPA: aldehyde dehydrogenase family protein, partial [Chthoniobacterales bacterium]